MNKDGNPRHSCYHGMSSLLKHSRRRVTVNDNVAAGGGRTSRSAALPAMFMMGTSIRAPATLGRDRRLEREGKRQELPDVSQVCAELGRQENACHALSIARNPGRVQCG